MVRIFNKLVRDRIPEIIESRGEVAVIHFADEEEYWGALRAKLQEEVDEFMDDSNIEEELVDIFEVLHAICEYKKIDCIALDYLKEKKKEERGWFQKRIILEETR